MHTDTLGMLFFDRDLDPVHKGGPQKKCLMQLPLLQDGVGPASMAVGITLLGHS